MLYSRVTAIILASLSVYYVIEGLTAIGMLYPVIWLTSSVIRYAGDGVFKMQQGV